MVAAEALAGKCDVVLGNAHRDVSSPPFCCELGGELGGMIGISRILLEGFPHAVVCAGLMLGLEPTFACAKNTAGLARVYDDDAGRRTGVDSGAREGCAALAAVDGSFFEKPVFRLDLLSSASRCMRASPESITWLRLPRCLASLK